MKTKYSHCLIFFFSLPSNSISRSGRGKWCPKHTITPTTHRVTGFLSQKQHEENWDERGGLVDSNFNMIETMHHHRVHQFHTQATTGGMATIHHQRTPCYNEMQQQQQPGVVLPSMTINRESKTPYSDATQVRNLFY